MTVSASSQKPHRRIEDYAVIGDMRTAVLVARDGSIDWFCAPRFDSGACFASLLGDTKNGRWRLGPTDASAVATRRYRGETMVLETEHRTSAGIVRVVEFMALRDDANRIVRMVEGVSGSVDMESVVSARFDYGCIVPWARREGDVVVLTGGPDALFLRGTIAHERDAEAHEERARFTIAAGERQTFELAYGPSYGAIPEAVDARSELDAADRFWSEWSSRCSYRGPRRETVVRSLLTLKALSYMPTGGILAAATTSLPETLGGERNWDYRFCWLRDATFTLLALLDGGYHDEASAWRDWLVRAVAGDPAQLQVLYGVAGERRLDEYEVDWLDGYEGSKPVRIGNAASGQFQLDIYGETVDALMQVPREGELPEEITRAMIYRLVDFVAEQRSRNDSGMWEIRGETRAFTHSRVMAWVAFDRGVALARRLEDTDAVNRWSRHRDELHDEICEHGFDKELNSFVQSYGSKRLDASTLLLPLVGFLPADDPRIAGTVAAVERSLLEGGFVKRYVSDDPEADGLHGHDNVFLACSCWLADVYAASGRIHDARAMLDRVLALCNDVGLLSEEYDVANKRQVGNFPQAFSHLAVVVAAFYLAEYESPDGDGARKRERMSEDKRPRM